jgi:hypothetical protein
MLIVGRGSRGLGVELTRGEGDRFVHCIDMEPMEEAARRRRPPHRHGRSWALQSGPRCRPLNGITVAGCCSQVPVVAPASASPQSGSDVLHREGRRHTRETSVGNLGLSAF